MLRNRQRQKKETIASMATIGTMRTLVSLPTMQELSQEPPKKLVSLLEEGDLYWQEQKIEATIDKMWQGYISPDGWGNFVWAFTVLLTINLYLVILGFQLAFGADWLRGDSHTKIDLIYTVVVVVLSLDIWVSLNRGFYDEAANILCRDRVKITINYVRSFGFACDMLSLLPIIVYISCPRLETCWIQALFILKYSKKLQYQRQISKRLAAFPTLSNLFWCFYLLLDAFVVSHYIAAIYILMDDQLRGNNAYQSNPSKFWMSNNNAYSEDITLSPWHIQYLYAQFFSGGTLSLVAPGPSPTNPVEAVYTICVMIFYIIYTTDLVKNIIEMVSEAYQKRQDYERQLYNLYRFLTVKRVHWTLRKKVENYFEYVWSTGDQQKEDSVQQLRELLPHLQNEAVRRVSKVGAAPWMARFDGQTLLEVMAAMENVLLETGEYIISKNIDDKVLFVTKLHSIRYSWLYGLHDQLVTELSTNLTPYIGEAEFVTDQPYRYDAMATQPLQVERIDRKKLIEVLKEKGQYLKFCESKDQAIAGKTEQFSQGCLFCGGRHMVFWCPEVYFNQYMGSVYLQQENYRSPCHRQKRRSWKPACHCPKPLQRPLTSRFGLFLLRRIDSVQIFSTHDTDSQIDFLDYFPTHNLSSLLL